MQQYSYDFIHPRLSAICAVQFSPFKPSVVLILPPGKCPPIASANCNNNCDELNWIREWKWLGMGAKMGTATSRPQVEHIGDATSNWGSGDLWGSKGEQQDGRILQIIIVICQGGSALGKDSPLGLSPSPSFQWKRIYIRGWAVVVVLLSDFYWHIEMTRDRTGQTMKNCSIKWISNALRRRFGNGNN